MTKLTAATRFRRLMSLLPRLAATGRGSLSALAAEFDCPPDEILQDLRALVERFDEPGDDQETIGVLIEGDKITVRTNHFLRPMRVTAAELCALEVGLAVLEHHADDQEAVELRTLRSKLARCITVLPQDHLHAGIRASSPASTPLDRGALSTLRSALRRHLVVTFAYHSPRKGEPEMRVVHPHGMILHHGSWYLSAWCETADAMRLFRCDRMQDVALTSRQFPPPGPFDPHSVMHEGRPFQSITAATLTVWYSPAIARWIAERDGHPVEADGSAIRTMPLADREWAIRHVLQYGPDARILAPTDLADELVARLDEMAGTFDLKE